MRQVNKETTKPRHHGCTGGPVKNLFQERGHTASNDAAGLRMGNIKDWSLDLATQRSLATLTMKKKNCHKTYMT